MKVYRCEDCQCLMNNKCCIYKKDKKDSIIDCFKNSFNDYKNKYNTNKMRTGINFKP